MTLTITYLTANHLQHNNRLIPKIFWNGVEVTPATETPDGDNGIVKWTYTCKLKAGQNTIGGYIADYDSSKHVIQEPQYTQPTAPEYTVNKVYDTYTLTAANNWRMVIENLPRSNPEKTQYYSYKIVETTGGDGYTVTYNTESGVVGGYLVMVNTKTPEQEEPTYELPPPAPRAARFLTRQAARPLRWPRCCVDITPGASGKGGKSDSCSSDPGNKPNVGK